MNVCFQLLAAAVRWDTRFWYWAAVVLSTVVLMGIPSGV